MKRLVPEILLAAEFLDFHKIFGRGGIRLGSLLPRIDKGAQSDLAQQSVISGAFASVKQIDDPLGEIP